MTISPFELALRLLINAAMALLLIGHILRSVQKGYAVGLWFDFQRELEPVRFWLWLGFVTIVVIGACWSAFDYGRQLTQ